MYEIHMKNHLFRIILRISLLNQNKQNRKFLIQNFPIHKSFRLSFTRCCTNNIRQEFVFSSYGLFTIDKNYVVCVAEGKILTAWHNPVRRRRDHRRRSRVVAELLQSFLLVAKRFAFKQARHVPRDCVEAVGWWGRRWIRLSSPRNQKQDQFTKYRLYCGFIILFTVFFVPFTSPRPHGDLLIYVLAHRQRRARSCLLIHFYWAIILP